MCARIARILQKVFRGFIIANVTLLFLLAVITAMHVFAHVCPFHMRGFRKDQVHRVVYGLLPPGALEPDEVWGGCVVEPLSGVCPYCGWPAVFERK